jgi:hypothetical protein
MPIEPSPTPETLPPTSTTPPAPQANPLTAQLESVLAFVRRYPAVLLCVAAIIPALGALGAPFYWIDDHSMILDNPLVTGKVPFSAIFTEPHFSHYAPLHEILIWAQWHLFGKHALGYRVVSILLHCGASVACYTMLKNLTQRPLLALGVALLWAVHPIQPECVDWITEQKTLWCGLFSFGAMAIYFNTRRACVARIVLGCVLMIIGALGKSPGLIVGPVIFLYELCGPYLPKLPGTPADEVPKRNLFAPLPFLLWTAVFAKVALWANGYSEELVSWGIPDTVQNLPGALMIYLRVAFLPWTASFFQDMPRVVAFNDPQFWGKLLVLFAVFGAGVAAVNATSRRLFLFAALAWAVALGPMLNISLWTYPAYDRFQYMALPFLLLGAAFIIEALADRAARLQHDLSAVHLQQFAWAVCFSLLALLGFMRGTLFREEVNVMLDATQKAPGNAYAWAQFANTLYPEWKNAGDAKRFDQQQMMAQTIGAAAEKARECWNFNEFFVTPVPLLVMAGQVLHDSRMNEPALPLLEAAVNEPKWGRFKVAREQGHRLLAVIHLDLALAELNQSARDGIPQAAAEQLAASALQEIENSRKVFRDSDRASWSAYLAHQHFAKLLAKRGDTAKSDLESRAALEALSQIPEQSQFYAQAHEELEKLKKPQ